jgi:hypothetical protein
VCVCVGGGDGPKAHAAPCSAMQNPPSPCEGRQPPPPRPVSSLPAVPRVPLRAHVPLCCKHRRTPHARHALAIISGPSSRRAMIGFFGTGGALRFRLSFFLSPPLSSSPLVVLATTARDRPRGAARWKDGLQLCSRLSSAPYARISVCVLRFDFFSFLAKPCLNPAFFR